MNTSPSELRPSPSDSSESRTKPFRGLDHLTPDGPDLEEWLANLWEGRYLIAGFLAVFLAVGVFNVWTSIPIYQTEAMMQIQGKREGASDAAFAKMEGLFSQPSETQAEIEVLKSNKVLGRTVETLGLDIAATPKLMPLVGRAWMRGRPDAPHIEIDTFELPEALRNVTFTLTAVKGGGLRWSAPDGSTLASGRTGDLLVGVYGGLPLTLKVRAMIAKPGQEFSLRRKAMNAAILDLGRRFDAVERGKMTNILGLTLKDPSPSRGAEILNEIINQYTQHKFERKTGDASKTLSLLQAKMPALKARLTESENRLNQFRSRSGSVDLNSEAGIFLQQGASLKAQISSLKQKKEELLRTYREDSDVVSTLNQQLAKLQGELGQVDSKMRSLPGTEQEMIRLRREVQVDTELYTALLNNIQQLQIASAGEVGNATVVDPATPNLMPMGPGPLTRVSLYGFLGLLMGGGTLMTRRALRRGIKDHRLIESKLGLPVVVTIPHSKAQEEHYRAISQRKEGIHLLALLNPDDLATESLRSLRTMLHFSMMDAPNSVIMVTGPSPSVGKTFTSANLAAVLAQTGSRVLIVDGDLRKGNLHHYFGLKNRIGGLSEVLSGRSEWKAVIRPVQRDDSDDTTEVTGLYLITSGILPPNPSELLMTNRFSTFIKEVSEIYDYIIIDAPPLLPVTDAVIIGAKVGTVLLVAKYGQHPLDEIRTCQKRLESHGVQIQGCIFNSVQPLGIGYNDYRYAYHYKYK